MIGEMRRLISVLAAAALVATPLATAGVAMAKDHDGGGGEHGRGDEGRGERHGRGDEGRGPGGGRGAPMPWRGGEDRGGGREYRGDEGRGGYPGGGRWDRPDPRYEPRYDRRAEPRYDPRAYGPPPGAYAPAPHRGGYLPPQAGGSVIQDYGRFRLRAPPRGYAWMRTGGGYALVSTATGQVFDVVPY
jgi:Ni/Co efflux regulator RcnB